LYWWAGSQALKDADISEGEKLASNLYPGQKVKDRAKALAVIMHHGYVLVQDLLEVTKGERQIIGAPKPVQHFVD
jgi:hypothetical protein